MLIGEIVSTDISPVEVLWQFTIWDLFSWTVFLLIFLGFLERAFEGLSVTKNECFLFAFFVLIFRGCLGQLEWCITMATVVSMVFLKLANICFPAKIQRINGRNHNVVFIRWNVFMMCVNSLAWGSLENLGIELNVCVICWLLLIWNFFRDLGHGLSSSLGCTFTNDLVNFDAISVIEQDTFFNIEVLNLFGIEALCLMSFHRSLSVNGLNETDHGLVTFRFERTIIIGLKRVEFAGSIL